ncbi:hypothetical protein B0T16DRAFT_189895 [Cercophora newfieldiana]|uniref:Zn(2)-C6 fungal-type domain-containing protein n=1 Tax=Cercophora newfieldiana TaxID=92897 RepID=A0AA39Y1U5_9PEZI|nr:hypothetical protein B0T16DRAFT_189895 [Cercophora newfieldiana]
MLASTTPAGLPFPPYLSADAPDFVIDLCPASPNSVNQPSQQLPTTILTPPSPAMSWPKPESDPFPLRSSTPISGTPQHKEGKNSPMSFVFSLQHRPRATRASVPKVRSGCITCKRRHVKCDEAKPACQRCLKWQGTCEGYHLESPSKRNRSKSPTSSQASSQANTDESATTPRHIDFPSPPADIVEDVEGEDSAAEAEREEGYFQYWMELSDNLAGSWFPATLFNQTIPQLGRTEPAVRYAALAVGALAKAVSSDRQAGAPAASTGSGSHYNHAVTYYGRALRLVRIQQDLNSDYTLRVAIIACVLFACFEMLHDSCDAAVNHINHGLMMVEQFMCTHETLSPQPATGKGKQRSGSPSPFILDEEILNVFQRLEYLIWTARLVQQTQTPSRVYLCPPRPYHTPIPPFPDMLEARRCLYSAQHHLLRAGVASSATCIDDTPLEQWMQAFEPLYAAAIDNADSDQTTFLQATSLLLQYHSARVCFQQKIFVDEDTPRFREIVQLSEVVLSNQPWEVFTIDQGPTLALFMAATRCSDQSVRDGAMKLLRAHPRRDAFWCSHNLVTVMEKGL